MKTGLSLIVAGLLVSTVPNVSFAGCATACVLPEVCRTSNNQFWCGLPSDRVVGGARNPGGVGVIKSSPGGAVNTGNGANAPSAARAPAPKKSQALEEVHVDKITSPRDASSGLPAAKRQQNPVKKETP